MSSDKQALFLQAFGHVAVDDAQRQALDDGGLADAGLADQHGVVLGAAGQHLDGAADLLVAADHGVELLVAGGLGQVAGVALQGVVAVLRGGRVGGLALADIGGGGLQLLGVDARVLQRLGGGLAVLGQGDQQALGGDEGVAGLLGVFLGHGEHAGDGGRHVELAVAAFNLGDFGQRRFGVGGRLGRIAAGLLDQVLGQAVLRVDQPLQQVLGRELLVAAGQRKALRGLHRLFGAVGIDVDVHVVPWIGGYG